MRDAVAAQAVTRAVPLSSAERARRYRAKKKAEAAASRSVPVDEEQIVTLARRKIEQNEDLSWRQAMDDARREICLYAER